MLYPVNLKVKGRRCLVVGGGPVARQKAASLRRAGAQVTLVSPTIDRALKGIRGRRRKFKDADLNGAFLVIAATDQPPLNARIKKACDRRGILVNVVDQPELCSFYAPSVLRRGPFMLTISTDGLAPGFSKTLRRELEKLYPSDFGRLVRLVGRIRKRIRSRISDMKHRMAQANRVASEALRLWRSKGLRAVRQKLR